MAKYQYITDPGHGWLEVPLADVLAAGVKDAISGCSYQNADNAYLEEDCDLAAFKILARILNESWWEKDKANPLESWWDANVIEVTGDGGGWIRNLPSYRSDAPSWAVAG